MDQIVNHDEAHHLAILKKAESNMARCYLAHCDRIAELEAALRPFGNAYRFTQKLGSMRPEYEASMTCTGEFTVEDLRRAADLTASK